MTTAQKTLLAYLLLILYLFLFPWTLKEGAPGPWFGMTWRVGRSAFVDIVLNILSFVPVGVCATLAFRGRFRAPLALMVGFLTSALVEILQGWLPGRISSGLDLITNTLGTLAGCLLVLFLGPRLARSRLDAAGRTVRFPLLFFLAALIAGHAFPFIPNYRLPHLRHAVARLGEVGDPVAVAFTFVQFLSALLLLRLAFYPEPGRATRFLLPAVLLLARPLFQGQPFTGGEWAAAWAGILVGAFARRERISFALFVLFPVTLALDQLRPFAFTLDAQPFGWIPLITFFSLPPAVVVRYFAEKLFIYGAGIFVVARWPLNLTSGGLLVLAILVLGEALQRYLPGRTPETTDLVLAAAAWCLLALDKAPVPQPETRFPRAGARLPER